MPFDTASDSTLSGYSTNSSIHSLTAAIATIRVTMPWVARQVQQQLITTTLAISANLR